VYDFLTHERLGVRLGTLGQVAMGLFLKRGHISRLGIR
jgi:hypothetical protein